MIALLAGMSISGCTSKFEDINTDPNTTTEVTPEMLAEGQILWLFTEFESEAEYYMQPYFTNHHIAWLGGDTGSETYNYLGDIDFRRQFSFEYAYKMLNLQKMIDACPEDDEETINAYTGVSHFIRAWRFFNMSMSVGDMPYSEALKGEDEVFDVPYDTQKDIMIGVLEELDEANELFENASDFDGDPVYGGDVTKWQKATNTLELRILLNLYKKTSDTDLNVISRFKDIVSNRPLMESNDDNFELVRSDATGQKYPYYKDNNNVIDRDMVTSTVVDSLKSFNDYRLFYFCDMTTAAADAGASETSWDSYKGIEQSLTNAEVTAAYQAGEVSGINLRYQELPEGEPTYLLSYAEQNFIIAEAIVRGFISGDAESYYQAGIRAAMKFTADVTPDNSDYHHNMKITDDYINSYLASDKIAFASTSEEQIKQIIVQKYLQGFLQSNYLGFFEYRRTGYPEFIINQATNSNDPADQMPVRWTYPENEYSYNRANVLEAVSSQYDGVDDSNGIMWILK